jgi:hypothetical protein
MVRDAPDDALGRPRFEPAPSGEVIGLAAHRQRKPVLGQDQARAE